MTLFVKIALIAVAVLLAGMFTLSILSGAPVDVGLQGNRLAPCPETPNCVSSMDGDESKIVPPIVFHGSPERHFEILRTAVESMPRTRVLQASDRYLHVEFTTPFFRFKDDVEFLIDRGAGWIHIRSASRVGHSDFGVNRKRVEAIRQRYKEELQASIRKRQGAGDPNGSALGDG